ncbi:MAG: A/G-specific adenine glycosylase [Alphaproteobacteria bacterium]|jgi:A/G-specific adenine glycosylase|nr:A/G-specific adenine glycosylase [Alphaproteobacteria bacterium]
MLARNAPTSTALLAWYDRERRDLPWRAAPGERADPYRVWLSEIMLQQTTVAAVIPYYARFLERWPDIEALAAAPLDAVLEVWAGLGYYARARNLHACAQVVAGKHGGSFPDSESGLRALPGIGAYTAAAIAAIAFGRSAVVVDGNVERVMARLFAVEAPLPGAKPALREHAATLSPAQRPGDHAQAVMDLGATVCVRGRPRCELCPWADACLGHAAGIAATLPKRRARKAKPLRRGIAFWITRGDGAVLLARRPPKGLLGGMIEVPSTDWGEAAPDPGSAKAQAPLAAERWRLLPGLVRHTFTHFELELAVMAGTATGNDEGLWRDPWQLDDEALPSVMRKVVAHALAGLSRPPSAP